GYIGLYEVASAFYGGAWEDNQEAKNFTLGILKELKKNADNWCNEYGYHFSVYCTSCESLSVRFCCLDTEKIALVLNIT
ncbi:anaerobic ribonucleoside-triphosphate reductase, partial [Enterococcus faecalis]|uniref:anaerobic ribonucleoside-triphosphate reductase n=1 Tax=Enterococcus faecalis TaxID=1351 RepID=UPI003D6BBEF5